MANTADQGRGITIAVDAMGGDKAPRMVIAGADRALKRHPDIRFSFFGDQARIQPLMRRFPKLARVSDVHHTDQVISNDDKPSVALRTGRQSSMRLAIDAVARGEASCVVSAGNTGALMAMAKVSLKPLPGIDRPAIAAVVPTKVGQSVMLDLGANAECTPENLLQFAFMGALFSRAVLGLDRPTIGLLNIGEEELKGRALVRDAAALLRDDTSLPGQYVGFVEGDGICGGAVDVIVTDGFTGNVALKTAEGMANLYTHWLRAAFRSSWLSRLSALIALGALRKLRRQGDPRQYNGAMFVGLRGVCIKSHGGTDARGFANALDVAADVVKNGFNDRVMEEVERHGGPAMAPPAGLDPSPETVRTA